MQQPGRMRPVLAVSLLAFVGLSTVGCNDGDGASDAQPLPAPIEGNGFVDIAGEHLEFVIDACSLEKTTIEPEDIPPGAHIPALGNVDVLMELRGTGQTSAGDPVLVELEALAGGLSPDIGESVTVTIGERLDPVRSWEAFRSYDPGSGDATTFYGRPSDDGPLIEVDEAVVRLQGEFAVRDGLSTTDEFVTGTLVATCAVEP